MDNSLQISGGQRRSVVASNLQKADGSRIIPEKLDQSIYAISNHVAAPTLYHSGQVQPPMGASTSTIGP